MDLAILVTALTLGLVEGAAEFLPISSTGHLIVVSDLLDFTGEREKTFQIFIQLGAIMGVIWVYRGRLAGLVKGWNHDPAARRFAVNVGIAFLPAALAGLALAATIKELLFNPITVAAALVLGGVIILMIERRDLVPRVHGVDEMCWRDALKVGCAQCLALFPGVSRSGATIMGGLVSGLSRTTATEFSFFLAIPTMVAATLYSLFEGRALLSARDIPLFAVGFLGAFVTGMIVVRLFLAFVSRHSFVPFAYYRIAFGTLVLLYFA